jgi:opacity protein-like surface antigen
MATKRLAAIVSAALLAVPSFAAAAGPSTQTDPPGPTAPPAAKAKAYGRFCQGESKKHVPGRKGTPFSQCVTAMAKLATGETSSPARACANLSKKHVAGRRGTPYSLCIAAAAKLGSG